MFKTLLKNGIRSFQLAVFLFCPFLAEAALSVKIGEPKTIGKKTVIKLELKNTFAEKVESARAVLFMMDGQGKVVGQVTKWVIGGTKDRVPLGANASATYNFVVSSEKPFSEIKVMFNRIVLDGGKLGDPLKDVVVTQQK